MHCSYETRRVTTSLIAVVVKSIKHWNSYSNCYPWVIISLLPAQSSSSHSVLLHCRDCIVLCGAVIWVVIIHNVHFVFAGVTNCNGCESERRVSERGRKERSARQSVCDKKQCQDNLRCNVDKKFSRIGLIPDNHSCFIDFGIHDMTWQNMTGHGFHPFYLTYVLCLS